MDNMAEVQLDPALIVEDVVAMQRRLAKLLSVQIGSSADITVAGSIADAKMHFTEHHPALVLIDIGLPDGSGIDLIAWLHAHHPGVTTLVISAWGEEDTVLAALRAGAIGYLLKEREDIELGLALQSIQRGGAPIDPFIARRILALLAEPTSPAPAPALFGEPPDVANDAALTLRESEVLQLVARGYSNRDIAELTTLSRFTIEGYTKTIYRKLAVSSRTAAIFEAKKLGLLS